MDLKTNKRFSISVSFSYLILLLFQSLIEFIPPEPQREGYTFGGWYKEKECINEWNFEVDITKEEIYPSTISRFEEYPGTYLYAKWNEAN